MDLDLSRFAWTPEQLREAAAESRPAKPRRRSLPPRGKKFVRGPIPLSWIGPALQTGRKSGNVLLAIWYAAGINRTNEARLTRSLLSLFDVSPRTARRILGRMQDRGLVRVEFKRGRGPDVTVLPTDGPTES